MLFLYTCIRLCVIYIVRASPLPPDPKPEDPGPGACCQLLGLPRRPREPPGSPRRQQEAAQEAPGNPLGSPRSRRRRQEGAEVPQTTQFAWFGDVEVPQTTVFAWFLATGMPETTLFTWFLAVMMPNTTLFTWFLATEMPKTTLSEGGAPKVDATLTQG